MSEEPKRDLKERAPICGAALEWENKISQKKGCRSDGLRQPFFCEIQALCYAVGGRPGGGRLEASRMGAG